jgi:hypothetical protein
MSDILQHLADQIENGEGYEIVYDTDPEQPTQRSEVNLDATLKNIADMIRSRIPIRIEDREKI